MPVDQREPFVFAEVARIPSPEDNVAISLQTFPAGSRILIRQLVFEFAHTVLEGHRFALHRIRKGEPLLSWGLPFGLALRDIEPGEYVCNEKILRALAERSIEFELPKYPNFADYRLTFRLEEANFRIGQQVRRDEAAPTFEGFRRNPRRGAGTRNYLVILGTNSRTAGFARALASRFQGVSKRFPNVNEVVAVEHTEGGSASVPWNLDLTLRTLAGFMVHPNVGAILCVDFGNELLSNAALEKYLRAQNYPLEGLKHEFFSIDSSFESALALAERTVESWLPGVNDLKREALPLRHLKLGLQCGGSDAFSGISANPLVGLLSRETVAFGGSASLAETDELIGAETYILQNVRNVETAKAFLATIERFQRWAAEHGHSAEGNPSGGNMFRGLYNITIKSLGAARKKDPATRLDYVIDFGEPMPEPGFYFMNSPGNDLESIAGQVASGCNLILFATGNGSITNFPFVPTIKVMSTTRRFEMVRNEMDFNAGRYLDGEALDALDAEAFRQMLHIASGAPSAGERAGLSQVQLWREWRGNQDKVAEPSPPAQERRSASSLTVPQALISPAPAERVALVLPTSLCSGQVAALIASKLNALEKKPFARALALPHTEGCGNSAGESEQLFLRTMAGYLAHPLVSHAVLLEHGCEKTHNDAFLRTLRDLEIDPTRFKFASIQLDGGIERVICKVVKQFAELKSAKEFALPLAFAFAAQNPGDLEREIVQDLISAFAGHSVGLVAPAALVGTAKVLRYGERLRKPGVYAMATPTDDLTEIVTGLGASGAQLIFTFASESLVPANPLVPTLQIASEERLPQALSEDVDVVHGKKEAPGAIAQRILEIAGRIRAGEAHPRSARIGNSAFQVTRGYSGISL